MESKLESEKAARMKEREALQMTIARLSVDNRYLRSKILKLQDKNASLEAKCAQLETENAE